MPRLLAVALAAALACAPHARTAVEPPAAAFPSFEVHPVTEIAGVKDPHEYKGKALCQRCHYPDGRLTDDPNALCAACHRFTHGNHPVNVVQKTPVKGLPLLAGGKVACHTCHDPHQKKSVLRTGFDELCQACHPRHR